MLRKMISENRSTVADCCSAHASYKLVIGNWKAVVNSSKRTGSTPSAAQTSSVRKSSPNVLAFITQAFQQKLISAEQRVRLVSLSI